jgi:hypothetical protein
MSPYGVRPLWLLYSTTVVLQRARNARIILKNSLILVLVKGLLAASATPKEATILDRGFPLISFLARYRVGD